MYICTHVIVSRRGNQSSPERGKRFLLRSESDSVSAGGHATREDHAALQEPGLGEAARPDEGADGRRHQLPSPA